MGKRHLSPKEIMEQCKAIAREHRMADRSPWTAMAIICSYVIMKTEGFKRQRILRITSKINEMEAQWDQGNVNTEELRDRLYAKSEIYIEPKIYVEKDIKAKKGTYEYWLDSRQIAPQNIMNEQCSRYMLFFYSVLIDEFGFGKERLVRVGNYINDLMTDYQRNKTSIRSWRTALLEDAGIAIEMPIDSLTQLKGSVMTG